jgi:hypothetical protein
MYTLHNIATPHKQVFVPRLVPALLISLFAAGSASAATLSVGPGKTYAAPCAAFGAAQDGDVIEITGNTTYSGDVCGISRNNLIIRGVNGRPRIDAAGRNAMGKGTWVVGGNNLTIENVEMLGAKVPDQNGAALRIEGTGFTLRQSFLHDNENGILVGANTASDFLIEFNEFGHNGFGDGYSHNLYIGNIRSLVFRNNFSHDANIGHNLKSRAQVNTIAYNRFSSLAAGETGSTAAGSPSYEIDLPNAGTSYVIGNVIEQPANYANPNILAYGEEGASNPGNDLYVVNNTFLNDSGSGGTFVTVGSSVTTPVLLQNNIFAGVGTTTNQANAIDKTNYRAATPGFVNRAAYDLHPTASALVIGAGSLPGLSASGLSLAPLAQYKHVASSEPRVALATIDIGAYQALAGTTLPSDPLPTPTPTPTSWTGCAGEGGTCSVSGTVQVRYGSGTTFVTKTVTGSVACTNAAFGSDPTPNVLKSCSVAAATVTPTPTPTPPPSTATWTGCAGEGGICSVSGTVQVRYGSGSTFVTRTVTGAIACTNAAFGMDPTPGVLKSCSYASTTVTAPAATWVACASEGGSCTFSGTRDVLYGAGTNTVVKAFTGAAACTNAAFGKDPAPDVFKSCSYSSTAK